MADTSYAGQSGQDARAPQNSATRSVLRDNAFTEGNASMFLAQAGMLPAYCLARFEELGARGGIDGAQTLTHRLAETDAQRFHVEVGGRARALFRLAVAEPRDVTRLQCGEVAVALRPDEAGELFDHALVTRVRGFLSLDCFCLPPCLAPRFDGRARQRFDVGRREHVDHTLRVFSALRHAQLAVARFQRGLVPCTANFLRLLLVAHFRGAKDAPARASFGIEDRKCTEPEGLPG
jgi:hypothetical protein